MNDVDTMANAFTKGIAYTENGGAPNIDNPSVGKTGERKSIFQFTPNTWKMEAKSYLGDENAPLTADNETYVVHSQARDWIKKGYTIRQMASMWNAGHGEPDAYTGKFSNGSSSVGVNPKYGVKFDVPSYANKVLDYTKKFYGLKNTKVQSSAALNSVLSTIQQASGKGLFASPQTT